MKKSNLSIVLLLFSLLFVSCKKDDDNKVKEPKVKVQSVEVLATQATFSWTVDYPGKISSVVEISLNEDMSDGMRFGTEEETDKKDFKVTAVGLREVTKYYFRYVIWNPMAKYEMEVKSFITKADVPKVKTMEVIDVTRTTATVFGEVLEDYGAVVTERGVCWGNSHEPTINDHFEACTTDDFTVIISGLRAEKTYYIRAYAKNNIGIGYGNETQILTQPPLIPIVTTSSVTDITRTSATGNGIVVSDGDGDLMERGVCWSTGINPSVEDDHSYEEHGTGNFSLNISNLTLNTTYYLRAYAVNSTGIAYGDTVRFKTNDISLPTVITNNAENITVSSAKCKGTLSDDGGNPLTALGFCWSTESSPSISDNHTTVSVVTGDFSSTINGLEANKTYYVCAYATNNLGTKYGNVVSIKTLPPDPPTGAVKGLFSVSSDKQVWFSNGNLQYQASTQTWRFAEHQYDYQGALNSNISSSYSGWIDLFGWGTSGWYCGNLRYRPYDSDDGNGDDYGPRGRYDLTGAYANSDWGVYNAISNGGNVVGQWRTLSRSEWYYVLFGRGGYSTRRFAKACVNGKHGLIILPDDWKTSTFQLTNYNNESAAFEGNSLTIAEWGIIENAGAVFLPAGGNRIGKTIDLSMLEGAYWFSSYDSEGTASNLYFYDNRVSISSCRRQQGFSVRLACDVE